MIKPLVGADRDVNSDAVVIRPVLGSTRGLAFSQALLPHYSLIDAYHMTSCTIDEAVRRLIAVGAGLDHMGGVDNFCWPNIQYHPVDNPDGKFKAAQLVRSCRALKDMCLNYKIPLLSGKDSMYVDGYLPGPFGETHKISALETLQFSTTGVIDDLTKCTTMDSKLAGDLVYVLGTTRNELGASEYYERFGYTGLNVPRVFPDQFIPLYRALSRCTEQGLVASVHGVYRGGLGVHLAMVAMGGNLGMKVHLGAVPGDQANYNYVILFSESAGRFIVTISPEKKKAFEDMFRGLPCACVGVVRADDDFIVDGINDHQLISLSIQDIKMAWKKPFGALV